MIEIAEDYLPEIQSLSGIQKRKSCWPKQTNPAGIP
jgi:hypothetical protein